MSSAARGSDGSGDDAPERVDIGVSASNSASPEAPRQPSAPLPKKQLCVLLLVVASDAIAFTQVFPYLPFMVVDFGMVDGDLTRVGEYAGYVASCYSLSQLVSAVFWGKMSDLFGRKAILLFGLVGTLVTTLCFGYAQTFPAAIAARAAWGLSNGNIGVAKALIGEVTDESNQAKAFSLFGLCGSIGRVIGPALGGYLARRHVHDPEGFPPDGLWGQHPYLLPSVACSVLTVFGLICGAMWLEEPVVDGRVRNCSSGCRACCRRRHRSYKPVDTTGVDSDDFEGAMATPSKDPTQHRDAAKAASVVCTKRVLLPCIVYALVGFLAAVVMEGFPTWSVVAPEEGGVGFTSTDIGLMNAVAGISMGIFQGCVYHRLSRRWGAAKTLYVGLIITIPSVLAMSVTDQIALGKNHWRTLLVGMAINNAYVSGILMAFTSVFQLITQSAPKKDLGAVNGLGQSLVAAARTFGPMAGSLLVAFGFNSGLPFPFDSHCMFVTVAVLTLIPIWITCSIQTPPRQRGFVAVPQDDGDAVPAAANASQEPPLEAGGIQMVGVAAEGDDKQE